MRLFVMLLIAPLWLSGCIEQETAPPASESVSAVDGLDYRDAVELKYRLFVYHETGDLDLERLTGTDIGLLAGTASSLIVPGALMAMKEVAPQIVATHRARIIKSETSEDLAEAIGELFKAFIAEDIDISDRPLPKPSDECIQMEEIIPTNPPNSQSRQSRYLTPSVRTFSASA